MSKLLAAIVVSAFAFSSASAFAADIAKKKEELTKEERAALRNRAEQLTAERARGSVQDRAAVAQAPKAKQEELTKEERAEMRNRAERLAAERAQAVTQPKAVEQPKAKTHPAKNTQKKDSKRDVKPAQPKA